MSSYNVEQNNEIEDIGNNKYPALQILGKAFNTIEKVMSLYVTGTLIVCLVASMCVEIILRFIFNMSLLGLPEVVELAVVTITFTSLALVQKEDSNIKVDALISWFGGRKIGHAINFLTSLAVAVLFVIISWVLAKFALSAFEIGHTTWNIYLPIWPVYTLVTISSIIIVIRVLVQMTDHLMNILKNQKGQNREYDWSKSTLD